MYISRLYREDDRAGILEFLRQNEFATLVTHDGGKPTASHLLMEVVESGDDWFVNGHMSKANPLWKTFVRYPEVLIIFQGPHTYISPTWYNHVNVPTWNYQAVHLYGNPRIVSGEEYYAMLSRLIARHEGGTSYRMESLPQDFVEKQMNGTVGFQVKVTRIEANYKLSQNRDDEDYHNIISRLNQREDEMSREVAKAMEKQR
ncbi:MAG: FMN-binding negative transcriptional regulator [Anaerolineales bacterium]|nr:FMN-binding negative transcriptional regulator [Anaerolineales bacterium]